MSPGPSTTNVPLSANGLPNICSLKCFHRFYGLLGVPMLFVFLVSASWTVLLAAIQVEPTMVANALMGTAEFDFGEFWLLADPDLRIAIPAATLLGIFAICYVGLATMMVFPGKFISSPRYNPKAVRSTSSAIVLAARVQSFVGANRGSRKVADGDAQSCHVTESPPASCPVRSFRRVMSKLCFVIKSTVSIRSDSATLALPKLVFQTTTLFTYLDEGFPLPIVFNYSILLLTNWILSGYRFLRVQRDPHYYVTRIFYGFDLFFAVFAPMEVLIYAYYTFSFDRPVFATRVAALASDSFDRTARMFADPTEVSLFRIAFLHLQFTTPISLLIKCLLNAFSILKWHHVIVHLTKSAHSPVEDPVCRQITSTTIKRWNFVHRLVMAMVLFCTGLLIFGYSIASVLSTRKICKTYEQCKVPSYQWSFRKEHCPCVVFVDRNPVIRTVAEWYNPPDTTQNLASLAFAGHLQVVQIVNKQLPYFPEELRKCHHLQQLILVYTKTLEIPDWAHEFSRLEYLHIEGDLTSKQLTYMPYHLFSSMPHLIFIHLGCHIKLPALPNFNSLKNLKYLVLAMIHMVQDIPPINRLVKLRKLSLMDNIRLLRLPHVYTLQSLNTIAVSYRTPVCCNGFIFEKCDLTAFSCLNRTAQGEPLVNCATDHIDPRDFHVLMNTDGLVCPPNLPFDVKDLAPTVATIDLACGGVLYKQCSAFGLTGICYPARMQPVSCQLDPDYVAVRRLEIKGGVGAPCDPSVESWLGCV